MREWLRWKTGVVEDGGARSDRLLDYLLRRDRLLEERCEGLENYTRRNNIRLYGVMENSETGDTVWWAENFLRNILKLADDFPLHLERTHRSLQQKPTDPNAHPRSFILKFLSFQTTQQVIAKAWSIKNLQFKGKKISMDHDYSPALQRRRREYSEIKKQLKEKNIKFQTPYPAVLIVHLADGIKSFNSAWEAAEGLMSLGISTTISEEEKLEKELHRLGWQTAGGKRRCGGPGLNRRVMQDMKELCNTGVV